LAGRLSGLTGVFSGVVFSISNAIVLLFRYVRAPHPDDREDLPAIIRISHALTMVISEAEAAAIRAIFHPGGYAPPDCGPAIPTDYTRLR
jgi:hypothetical protein